MGNVTQIAFQIDVDTLAALDEVAARESVARSEILRVAVRHFLARRREDDIEARLAAGYGDVPPTQEERDLAEVSLDGLHASELDW